MVQKTLLRDTPENLISAYKNLLEKNGVRIKKIVLFGSYANGKAKTWSDLDLCIVSEDFGKNYEDDLSLLNRLTIQVDPMIEPHPYHPKDLADYWDPLANEINKNGKVVA